MLAAATVAQAVTSIIQSTFPKTRQIKTEMAHKVPDGLFQEFVSVTSGDRALRLLEVLDRGRRMNMDRYAAQVSYIYVSSYCCCVCVLILLYMCPHTAAHQKEPYYAAQRDKLWLKGAYTSSLRPPTLIFSE